MSPLVVEPQRLDLSTKSLVSDVPFESSLFLIPLVFLNLPQHQCLPTHVADGQDLRSAKAAAATPTELALADLAAADTMITAFTSSADITDAARLVDVRDKPPAAGAGAGGSLVAEVDMAGIVVRDPLEADRNRDAGRIAGHIPLEDAPHIASCSD
jgi:hypothetical protein